MEIGKCLAVHNPIFPDYFRPVPPTIRHLVQRFRVTARRIR